MGGIMRDERSRGLAGSEARIPNRVERTSSGSEGLAMAIQFQCPKCKHPIDVPAEYAGGKGTCAECGVRVRIPRTGDARRAVSSGETTRVATQGTAATFAALADERKAQSTGGRIRDSARPAPVIADRQNQPLQVVNERPNDVRIVKAVVAIAIVVLVAVTSVTLWVSHQAKVRRLAEATSLLSAFADTQKEVDSLAEGFDFTNASNALASFRNQLDESTSAPTNIRSEVDGLLADLSGAKRDYQAKIAKGWEVFEGRFIAPDEKQRIVAAREEERIEREQEVRRSAAARQAAERHRLAQQRHAERQREVEENLWRRASDTTGATSLEDIVILTLAYLQHFPAGIHTTEARGLQSQAVERLWMNRVLDLVDLWQRIYSEIRQNQALIDQALRSPDAWMHANQLEKIAENNVDYQRQLEQVSASLSSLGAGGFAAANMPTQTPSAITDFCRRNRDEMRYQRWRDARINQAGPQAQHVSVGSVLPKSSDPEEETEWSQAEQAWASLPFLEGTAAMARFFMLFPDGRHANEAQEQIVLGIEMDWSARVFLNMRTIQGYRKIAEEYKRLAADDVSQREELLRKSRVLLEQARDLISTLQQMGFAGDLNMELPHADSNLTEIVLFFRGMRLPGKYSRWAEEAHLSEFGIGSYGDGSQGRMRADDEGVDDRAGESTGEGEVLYRRGMALFENAEVERNAQKALRLFQRASELDHGEAMYMVGKLHFKGIGVAQDKRVALEKFRKAAELGSSDAMCWMGFLHQYGDGVRRDDAKAIEWYRRAIALNNATAMFNMGALYQNGQGVRVDFAEALTWYRRAADLGKIDGMFAVGAMYDQGHGVAKSPQQAVYWYRKAAEGGYAKAMWNLSNCYGEGYGVERDLEEASRWYRKAKSLGYSGED